MTRDGIAPEELLSLFTVAANPLAKGEARSFVVVEGMDWNVSACEKCVGAICGNREVGFCFRCQFASNSYQRLDPYNSILNKAEMKNEKSVYLDLLA